MVDEKSPEWLPPGFTEKLKYKNGRRIKYFCNVATGAKYYSKKDVLSSVTANHGVLGTPETTNDNDNKLSSNNEVDAAVSVKSNDLPDWLPNGWKMEEKPRNRGSRKGSFYKVYTELSSGSKFYSRAAVDRYLNSADQSNKESVQNKPENVDVPIPDVSQQCVSTTKKSDGVSGKKKDSSSKTGINVAADELPPGWIKEIKTSKSGNKIRKDPFYTDPVSGYVFRSKLDALRFLKTNDIASCASKPKKRDEIFSSDPAPAELSEHQRQLFPDGELNGTGSSGLKSQVKSAAKGLKRRQANDKSDSVEVASSGVDPELKTEESKEDLTGSSGMKNVTDKTPPDSRKSKKRRELSVPSRTSKRLAGGGPETVPTLDLNECSTKASAKDSSGIEVDTPQPSESEPLKEDVIPKPLQVIEPLPNVVENIIPEEKVVEEPKVVVEEKVVERQSVETKPSQETSQLCYDFGDSWSDPLEFALKTLRGELPLDDPLTFPGGLNVPYNQMSGPSQSNASIVFQNEFLAPSESSKQKSPINPFAPNTSSFSSIGNLWNGFNSQSSTDGGKKD